MRVKFRGRVRGGHSYEKICHLIKYVAFFTKHTNSYNLARICSWFCPYFEIQILFVNSSIVHLLFKDVFFSLFSYIPFLFSLNPGPWLIRNPFVKFHKEHKSLCGSTFHTATAMIKTVRSCEFTLKMFGRWQNKHLKSEFYFVFMTINRFPLQISYHPFEFLLP